jgi:heptosyltransferase II
MVVDAQKMEARSITCKFRPFGKNRVKQSFQRILVIQTAFIGDVILTLPLIQVLTRQFTQAEIDVVATPQAAGLFTNHPSINRVIPYDKRGKDRGIGGLLQIRKKIAVGSYQLAIIPHRSVRSAFLALASGIVRRIGFSNSAGRWLFTDIVRYRPDLHEIERNLSLLSPLVEDEPFHELPSLYPGSDDINAIERMLHESGINLSRKLISIAPGTIWNTKRWLKERFAEVARQLSQEGFSIVLIGSDADRELCEEIRILANDKHVLNTAGTLTLLQSAELIKRSSVILSNDSAPMHMGVAVRTPVVAVFGATSPSFGFYPYGSRDVIVETLGLSCRPCSIHGGHECPITTFVCMKNIDAARVLASIRSQLEGSEAIQ